MKGERPTQVNLKQKLTVFLFYDTAYVDSKGVVHFADDYYGHDAQLEKALRQRLSLPAQELTAASLAFARTGFGSISGIWSRRTDLNRGPADYESAALPLSYAGLLLAGSGFTETGKRES